MKQTETASRYRETVMLPFLGFIVNLTDGTNRNKCPGIKLFHVIHKSPVFLFVHNGDDFPTKLMIVGPDDLIDSSTALPRMRPSCTGMQPAGKAAATNGGYRHFGQLPRSSLRSHPFVRVYQTFSLTASAATTFPAVKTRNDSLLSKAVAFL